ncbi:MAG: hypothetical protein KGI38_06170 [Thaumarchaeota archaeon]|nr:hypothetical protein [Nitrososphaerota archaeon]
MLREEPEGYVVDKTVFNNIVRIMNLAIPVQVGYVAFFAASVLFFVLFPRPLTFTSTYVFGLFVVIIGLFISIREVVNTSRQA